MKKFLDDLRTELKKLNFSKEEIEEIISDHQEMIESAQEQGVTDEELHSKFGDPEKLAQDLKENTATYTVEEGGTKVEDYTLFKAFPVSNKAFDVVIGLVSEDVRYEIHDQDTIEVHYKKIDDIDEYLIDFDGSTFTLKREHKTNKFSFSKESGKFVVRVPEGIQSQSFAVKTVSADGKFEGIASETLEIKATSGDMKLNGAVAKVAKFTTVSGDVHVKNGTFDSFDVSMVSGDTSLQDVAISGDLGANTVSGDLKLENVKCANFTLKTVSGDCKGNEFYPQTVSLGSVSGDIKIENEVNTEIKVLKQKSLSGKVKIR